MAGTCAVCFGSEHAPECPELRWPDGRLRGTVTMPMDLPPFNPELPPPRYDSPLARELAAIFAGATERMIADYVAEQRRLHVLGSEPSEDR